MLSGEWLFLIVVVAAMTLTIWSRKLTVMASLTGGLIAAFIYAGAGYPGIAMLAAFFVCGTAATSWRMSWKQALGFAERNKGRRTAGQVAANAGVAAIAGIGAVAFPEYQELSILLMAACFSAATADTLSSEIGTVCGKRFINIISFKKDERGADGVVSMEGTLIGIAGSAVIAVIYAARFGWDIDFFWIIIGGTAGNVADSVLGALWERKRAMHNNTVNFLNTLFAAVVAFVLHLI
jgi:uncharacterized protein (TIGR00297 family)